MVFFYHGKKGRKNIGGEGCGVRGKIRPSIGGRKAMRGRDWSSSTRVRRKEKKPQSRRSAEAPTA